MSSLPPYNPDRSERSLWLLNSSTPRPERQRLLELIGRPVVVEAQDAVGLSERIRRGGVDVAVVAPEGVLEALVLELVGGRPGMARLRFLSGAISEVQMLPDRAVLRHLNLGAAV